MPLTARCCAMPLPEDRPSGRYDASSSIVTWSASTVVWLNQILHHVALPWSWCMTPQGPCTEQSIGPYQVFLHLLNQRRP
jgi:hypothetical protein